MFEDEVIADIKALAQGYAMGHGGKHKPLKLRTVSHRLYGHGEWLQDFLKGRRSASISTIATMVADFRADWPESQPWPELKRLY